jgi:hypothetical protein
MSLALDLVYVALSLALLLAATNLSLLAVRLVAKSTDANRADVVNGMMGSAAEVMPAMVAGDSLPLSACGILLANASTLGRGGDEHTATIGAMLSYFAVMVSFYCPLLLFEPELIYAQESFLPALRHYGPQVGITTSDECGVTGFAALIASVVVYAAWSARGSWTDEVRPFHSLMLSLVLMFLSQKNVTSAQPSTLRSNVGRLASLLVLLLATAFTSQVSASFVDAVGSLAAGTGLDEEVRELVLLPLVSVALGFWAEPVAEAARGLLTADF